MKELRTQSRLASFMESMANIAIGIIIQTSGQAFLSFVMHIKITGHQFVLFTLVMTLLSVVRSYFLRRMWNAEWWKRFKRNHPSQSAGDFTPEQLTKASEKLLTPRERSEHRNMLRAQSVQDEIARIKAMSPEALATYVANLSAVDRERLDKIMRPSIDRMVTRGS